jgi:hypothetical protein
VIAPLNARHQVPRRGLYGRGLAKLRKNDTDGRHADVAAAKTIVAGVVDVFKGYGF